MAPNTKDTTATSSSNHAARVSPTTSGAKRKQEENDEPARHVSQRIEEVVIEEEKTTNKDWKESMKKFILEELWSTDADVVEETMGKLASLLYADNDLSKRTESRSTSFSWADVLLLWEL